MRELIVTLPFASPNASFWKAALEDKAALKSRIEQASRYVPLERLAISPQCGFASTEAGNLLTEADEDAKLRLVVEVAREVWG